MRERLVTWGLILGLVILAGVLFRWEGQASDRADNAEQALADLRAKQATLVKDITALEAKRAVSRKELDRALEANPEWATQPVPPAVTDSLCKRIRCE